MDTNYLEPGEARTGTRGAPRGGLGLLAVALVLLTGCRNEMYNQPRYKTFRASTFFANGTSARPLIAGTVARGHLDADELLATGKINGQLADQFPFPIGEAELKRGQERFRIYCAPCHGERGDGKGMVVRRGFPGPPPYYGPTRPSPTGTVPTYADLRQAPAGHFFDVMTNGHGVMYSYASRVSVEDRWKIAAYIRVLQLSQYATQEDLKAIPQPKPEELAKLREGTK